MPIVQVLYLMLILVALTATLLLERLIDRGSHTGRPDEPVMLDDEGEHESAWGVV